MINEDLTNQYESQVRHYSRIFPAVFSKAKDSYLFDINNKKYIDFFAAAGSLNYGHNNELFKNKLLEYIASDGITQALDMHTEIRAEFIKNFQTLILQKRNLQYKMQFTGPTGTDTIEAALKLARKYTGRKNIVYFSNSYHGMSMGSLSITPKKDRIGIPVGYSLEFPFYQENSADNFSAVENYLRRISKEEYPAAIVLETIQAEGGINVASVEWLQSIAQIAKQNNILLIVDDIQVGVGRSGDFFSFERAKIYPDLVCLSKSLSAYGLPLSVLLIKPELDIWNEAEHTGTFRGNNLAFLTANEALLSYWQDDNFLQQTKLRANFFKSELEKITKSQSFDLYGLGMIYGIDVFDENRAKKMREKSFANGLMFEICGPKRSVIKFIPPLTTSENDLREGLKIFQESQ